MRFKTTCGVALLCIFHGLASARADDISDLASCADERVRTAMLTPEQLASAAASCTRVLEGVASEPDRQKAAFFRALMRFLHVMQAGMALGTNDDGSMQEYQLPKKEDVADALADIQTAIELEGPLKGEALALRVTINQAIGQPDGVADDIEAAVSTGRKDGTPFVQRALEAERRGDVGAALVDLDQALESDSQFGPALVARGRLLRRMGHLAKAREDLTAAIALGSPFRRLALLQKSEIELRMGDLRAAFDDILSAARETGDMSVQDARAMNVDLLIRAGDLALDSLKDPDVADSLFRDAAKLSPDDWRWQLGLGRSAEARGEKHKAIEIYKRILDGTRSTPSLLERNDAAWRLRRLTQPLLQRRAGEFAPGFEFGIVPENPSPDGLKRLAFIIGSGNYTTLPDLPNARRDATIIANRLADMGFDAVEIAEDIDRENMVALPSYIAERARAADIVVVFYAGHGVETGGVNYLVPVDAAVENATKLQATALALQDLTKAASQARRGALVIIDACRDDPFIEAKAVASSRGLARPSHDPMPAKMHMGLAVSPTPPLNNVILHSTQPGKTAADGSGLDSPFVIALLQTLSTPGLTMNEVVRETATRVSELTDGQQIPTAYGDASAIRILPGGIEE